MTKAGAAMKEAAIKCENAWPDEGMNASTVPAMVAGRR